MITLQPITENNLFIAAALKVHPEQQKFVSTASMILARAYACRYKRAVCWGIYEEKTMVGLAMLHDMIEEPACYHLCQFLIDEKHQGKGYGREALRLVLSECRKEGKFTHVEVCVKKENKVAISLYEKAGFRDCGYTDPNAPDSLCMTCDLSAQRPEHLGNPYYTNVCQEMTRENETCAMGIKYRDIILRDMVESDIADEIRWNTVETEWALWDAPWEMEVELPKFDPEAFRAEALRELQMPREDPRWHLELDTADGIHIGSVSCYLIDENWNWISARNVLPGQKTYKTLGIEINDSCYWNQGLGKQALTAWICYHLGNGIREICLQTWSGNVRMIKCAEKLGFHICHREVGNRQVRGGIYDGLTFRLDLDKFHKYLAENS